MRLPTLTAVGVAALLSATMHARDNARESCTSPVWVFTYLKALPGQREALARFITRNWFAMDSAARRDGVISDFQLHRGDGADTTWDFVEVTTFADSTRHAHADSLYRTRYRPAHRMQLENGRSLPALGRIVRTVRTQRVSGQGDTASCRLR